MLGPAKPARKMKPTKNSPKPARKIRIGNMANLWYLGSIPHGRGFKCQEWSHINVFRADIDAQWSSGVGFGVLYLSSWFELEWVSGARFLVVSIFRAGCDKISSLLGRRVTQRQSDGLILGRRVIQEQSDGLILGHRVIQE